jgi:DNA helicase-2/ATP-dependent DNA helicase PcrA
MEEERRLCYVAMTRAKQRLTMTNARARMLFGRTTSHMPSRFLDEVPVKNSVWKGKPEPKLTTDSFGDHDFGSSFREGGYSYGVPTRRRSGESAPDRGYTRSSYTPPTARSASTSSAAKTAATADLLQVEKGDVVMHQTFGQGTVLSIRKMGNDALVEVAFDKVGTKKLMLRTAGKLMAKL